MGTEGGYEEEKRGRIDMGEKAGIADRKANALHGELEESRSLLNSADRGKKQTEIDDMLQQAKHSEDSAKKAMVDAARLADELRAEQDHAATQDKAKRALETQINELENRLADANEVAVKSGRNAMAKLEGRIREMEMELGGVQSKTSESYKGYQKSERRIKELMFQ